MLEKPNPCADVPDVLGSTGENGLPQGLGCFQLSSFYSGPDSRLSRRQFTGRADLRLHIPKDGEADVAVGVVGLMSLAYVRSTGHDVVVPELQRPNLLVPVAGTLSSRNGHTSFALDGNPWVLFGRGTRETTVHSENGPPYQAFVLSMPTQYLGNRLASVEERGGMIWGSPATGNDVHLVRLVLALATQMALSGKLGTETRVADAWTTLIIAQLNACLDVTLGSRVPERPRRPADGASLYVRRAEDLIANHLSEISSLRDIAMQVGISERTLQAAFRKIRGATPSQILSQERLQCARRALLDPDGPDTVSEACAACGIQHHSRFSKLYREAFGEYPLATLSARSTV